ncbi:MAG: MFS transporter [Actinobacteria bacterium]|nr:MFS transporter [Actinomycetota bacterium]
MTTPANPAKTPKPARTPLPFEVWALVAGGFAVALGYGVVAPAIPQFALEFGVSNFAASAIVSAFALMRLVSAPLAGWAVARMGERRTYTIGILIVAVSTGAAALAANYPQFVLLRGAGGIGSTLFTVAATALLAKVSPVESRGRVASLNAAGFLLGGLFGPVLGGVVAVFGLRAPFVFYFFTLLVAAAIVAIALRGSQAAGAPGTPGAKGAQGGPDISADADTDLSLKHAMLVPQFRTLLFSVFSFGWASYGVRVSLIPLLVAVTFGGDATMAAWILAAYAAGNAVFIFPAGRWTDTIGRKPMLVVGLSILAVAYAAMGIAPSMWVLGAIMLVAGAGSALANPGQQAVLADVLAKRRGGGPVAAYSMASDLGGVLGPALAGLVVDLAGFSWAFVLTAVLLAAAASVWSLSRDSRSLA